MLVAVALAAQDADSEAQVDVFAPFVSSLRVAVRDPQVRLTWRDSPDLEEGTYQVFRHTVEISADTLSGAELIATVEPGTETYLDTPLEAGDYYYAILASDADGRLFPILVPFRNKTIRSVTVAQLETEEDLAASVYDIAAQVQDDAVVVRFDASRTGRTLTVYRSTSPFESIDQIADATFIDEFDSSTRRFIDYPVPGVDYYYAIFDKALIERGTARIDPNENVLGMPIRLGLPAIDAVAIDIPRQTKRPAPLPILQIASGIRDNGTLARGATSSIRSPLTFGDEAERVVTAFIADAPAPRTFSPEPVILPEQRAVTGEGASRTLAQIVTTYFAEARYADATSLLRNLLDLPLSDPMDQLVRFYLGQALYFDGQTEAAFMELLIAAEGELYATVRPWIDGILLPRG